jgi:cytochrome c
MAKHEKRAREKGRCILRNSGIAGSSQRDKGGEPLRDRFRRCGGGLVFGALLVLAAGSAAADADDPGAAQFKKSCGTCHTVDPHGAPRQGPNLHGVVGRPAGAIKGFKYSPAFQKAKAGITWDAATLDRWITNPQDVIPGTVMMYHQADPEKRQLVINYLKTH